MSTFIVICIFLITIWYFFFQENPPKDDLQNVGNIKTKEFLMTIPKFSEKLMNTYPTLATIDFDFASRKWSAALEYSTLSGNVLLTLNNKNQTLPYSKEDIFLSIAIVQSKGQHIFHWYNIDMLKSAEKCTGKNIWTGPSADYCLKNRDIIFPDDILTLFIRISTYSLPFCVTAKNHHGYSKDNKEDAKEDKSKEGGVENRKCLDCKVLKNLSKNLKDLYLDEKDPDVDIVVRSVNVKAHRAILKARSPVLTAMLSENVSKIEEDDCDPKDFVTFLHFLYSGTVDKLDTENAISVYIIADKYEVPDLKEACAESMVSRLTVNSVSNVISLSLKHEDDYLLEKATDYFIKNAMKIFLTDEWQEFLKENPTKANELVINSYLNLKSS